MKTIQLIFRILLSPVVFLVSLVAMVIFPGTIRFLLGIVCIIVKLLGGQVKEDWEDILTMTTMIIWFPFVNTFKWIVEAKFIE